MLASLSEAALSIATGLLIAVTSAWVTVRLSINRFRSEKWWERKAESYTAIILALHDMKLFLETSFDHQVGNAAVPDDYLLELGDRWRRGEEQLARSIDMGSFLFSDAALAELRELQICLAEVAHNDFSWEKLGQRIDAIDECLHGVRHVAAEDLKVKNA